MLSHARVLDPARAFLLVVDLQETYRDKLHEWERTLRRSELLVRGARLVGLPVFYTEQYPRGLGATAPELHAALDGAARFEKRTLSALGAPGLREALLALGRRQAIVCGIETHACINHTVHELLASGFAVHLPADALSSRSPRDHELAWHKMMGSGAIPGSVESVLFECLRSADHPAFKAVQALFK
jgi:nicotinamidase-related amidase